MTSAIHVSPHEQPNTAKTSLSVIRWQCAIPSSKTQSSCSSYLSHTGWEVICDFRLARWWMLKFTYFRMCHRIVWYISWNGRSRLLWNVDTSLPRRGRHITNDCNHDTEYCECATVQTRNSISWIQYSNSHVEYFKFQINNFTFSLTVLPYAETILLIFADKESSSVVILCLQNRKMILMDSGIWSHAITMWLNQAVYTA